MINAHPEGCAISSLASRSEPWAKRLTIPNYPVGDAARYAGVTAGTIRSWQQGRDGKVTMSGREKRAELSYLQLIELAVVAGCRKAGLSLRAIRAARDFVASELKSEYPFAVHEFATDGKRLLLKFDWAANDPEPRKWMSANEKGQLSWDEIIGRTLKTFEYEKNLAIRWHVGGEGSKVIIDPRIAFGAPSILGRPTWVFRDRWLSGEPLEDTADDFQISVADITAALQFEGVDIRSEQPQPWLN